MHDPAEGTQCPDVTRLLHRVSEGDKSAENDLLKAIESELRKIASIHMSRQRSNHTLQTTALMNEAVMRLLGAKDKMWNDRQHFLAVASRAMRCLLIDYARKPHPPRICIDALNKSVEPTSTNVLDIHEALEEFAAIAPRQAQLVELRFFGGLTLEETAEVLGISERMADKDWALAKAWLRRRLAGV